MNSMQLIRIRAKGQ
ncbi:hypothetical protein E3O48_16145 [Cryobacterium sp. HLT2-28]|nr:hypothetical protein E3O48_16145 [Cryobacterium sp. HLT2-28]